MSRAERLRRSTDRCISHDLAGLLRFGAGQSQRFSREGREEHNQTLLGWSFFSRCECVRNIPSPGRQLARIGLQCHKRGSPLLRLKARSKPSIRGRLPGQRAATTASCFLLWLARGNYDYLRIHRMQFGYTGPKLEHKAPRTDLKDRSREHPGQGWPCRPRIGSCWKR